MIRGCNRNNKIEKLLHKLFPNFYPTFYTCSECYGEGQLLDMSQCILYNCKHCIGGVIAQYKKRRNKISHILLCRKKYTQWNPEQERLNILY